MNPLISSIVGSLLRMALGGVVAWLIEKGVMQPDQTAAFYGAISTAVAAVAWAIYENVIRKRTLNTAAALPPTPVDVVTAMVKSGVHADANSPVGVVPNVQVPERL